MKSDWDNRRVYRSRPLHQLLTDSAALEPETVILRYLDEVFTFGELDSISNSFANALSRRGIGLGSRVALFMQNSPAWLAALFGISRVGASAVLINPAWQQHELLHALELTNPDAIVVDADTVPVLTRVAFGGMTFGVDCEVKVDEEFWKCVNDAGSAEFVSPSLDWSSHELLLPFSSGTTGMPKAVRHTHHSVYVSIYQWMTVLNLTPADRIQNYSPLAHILGVVNVGASVLGRAPLRLFRRFSVDDMLASIERDRITIGVAVAPVAAALAQHPQLEEFDLSSLRFFNWAATPLNPSVANRFTERTGVRWLQAYGTTESPVLFANPVHAPHRWRLDSAGLPVADVEAKVVDVETLDALPHDQSGEVVVRSPNRMIGYLPEDANDTAWLPGGWYRTGDVGWMEAEGWLHLTDRLKEMIKSSGFQIAPAEIEALLFNHPAVADCAVFGVEDEIKNEVPAAVVTLKSGAEVSAAELRDWAAPQLAAYKRLAFVKVVDEVPRTASGKTLRRSLSKQFRARSG